jgi:hypothetical protein
MEARRLNSPPEREIVLYSSDTERPRKTYGVIAKSSRHRATAQRSWRSRAMRFLDYFAPSGARSDQTRMAHVLTMLDTGPRA